MTKDIDIELQASQPVFQNITNQTQNNQNTQNFPILSRMIFPHSNVTINYNFSK